MGTRLQTKLRDERDEALRRLDYLERFMTQALRHCQNEGLCGAWLAERKLPDRNTPYCVGCRAWIEREAAP